MTSTHCQLSILLQYSFVSLFLLLCFFLFSMNFIVSLSVIALFLSFAPSCHCQSVSWQIQFNWSLLHKTHNKTWSSQQTWSIILYLRLICWCVCLLICHYQRKNIYIYSTLCKQENKRMNLYICLHINRNAKPSRRLGVTRNEIK